MRLDILVYTHSSCLDVLRVFLGTLKNNVQDYNLFRIVILTDSKNEAEQVLESAKIKGVVIEYDDAEKYSSHFDCLDGFLAPFFLYLQEDFFFVDKFSFRNLSHYLDLMDDHNIPLIRLTPSASYRSKAYLNYYLLRSQIKYGQEKFLRVNFTSHLPVCLQPTIWNSSEFLKMHREVEVGSLREEWSESYRKYFKYRNIQGLATKEIRLPYLAVTAVRKGKWNFTDYEWGLALNAILQEFKVNPLDRGIAFYRFKVLETRSTLLKDLWHRLRFIEFFARR